MTAITCVWSASTAMVALIKGLYSVFDVSKNHNYIFMRILAILYTVVFVMTLLVSMGLMVFGDMLYEWLITVMPPACLFCSSAARSPCGCSTAASTAMFPT